MSSVVKNPSMKVFGVSNTASVVPFDLIVTRDNAVVTVFRKNGKRTYIGRNADCDLHLQSKYVSARHAVLEYDGHLPFIADLCSRNKTFVNNKQVEKAYLKDGDIVNIGYFNILYRERADLPHDRVTIAERKTPGPDAFRLMAESVDKDPDMLAADLDTVATDEEDLASYGRDDDNPGNGLPVDGDVAAEARSLMPSTADVALALPGSLDFEMIDAAAAIADTEGRKTIEVLEERSGFDATGLTAELARIFDYPTMPVYELMAMAPDFATLPIAEARNRNCILATQRRRSIVVFCDPFDANLRPWIESRIPAALDWVLVSSGDLRAYISRHEQSMRAMDSAITGTDGLSELDGSLEDLSLASISKDSSPVIRLVHSTLYDALKAGASDIHMESGVGALEIRYRIDGVLVHVATVKGAEIAEQVISRIKVMSELDIAERRIPQDGRFKTAYDGRPIDFRVSIMPSSFGEDGVLRVLDKQSVTDQMTELSLDSLGFESHMVASLRQLSERPYGMLLVTGPTGSGKTTTLYAAISETNSGLGKIVTIEDPVEYQLAGVLQIPVNEKKGLTFARGLRSILRHDPDKIMVGEIRDPETAQIAVQSALTGHLVFTTVHANNVFDVLSRFTHMGVDPYSFVSALNGILAQRLLRLVCRNCAESITPTAEMLAATREPEDVARAYHWRAGQGCSECRGTGYKGRKAIGELLVLDDEIREAIIARVPVRRLKELATASGLQFIRTAALNLVRDGLTTIEEVNRVTTMA